MNRRRPLYYWMRILLDLGYKAAAIDELIVDLFYHTPWARAAEGA